MNVVLKHLSLWKHLVSTFSEGGSVLLTAPRNFGLPDLYRDITPIVAPPEQFYSITLDSRQESPIGRLDFARVWRACCFQIGFEDQSEVPRQATFLLKFLELLRKSEKGFFVLIEGAKRGNEANHLELLMTFRKLLAEGRLGRKLRVLASDDWSTLHYCTTTQLLSELDHYTKERVRFLELEDVMVCVRANCAQHVRLRTERTRSLSAEIISLTGGHAGLINEILLALNRCEWKTGAPSLAREFRHLVQDSSVITEILNILQENPTALCDTALQYKVPSIPPEYSPRTDILAEHGILKQVHFSLCLELCAGVIADIVQEVANAPKHLNPPLGAVFSETGIAAYEGKPFTASDDDLVILHLSDLHVSTEQYRFRLMLPGECINPNQPALEELLVADLDSLRLLGRIDGVVFTGDFVWDGKDNKSFNRARDTVLSLLEKIRVPIERVLFIPGNHDVEWNPSALSSNSKRDGVSNENYQTFLSQIPKESKDGVSTLLLTSNSGHYRLRILGFDSNGVEGPAAPGVGFVRIETLLKAGEIIRGDTASEAFGSERLFTWIALHHHVFPATSPPMESAETGRVSVLANAATLLRLAGELRAEIILHGHEHQPSVTVARRWPLDDEKSGFSTIVSVGAGSIGIKSNYLGPIGKNHYYIIARRPQDALIMSRCLGNSALRFSNHNDLLIPFRDRAHL
jgi:3',5'-cyclic AMP phosphodiesterase CpdA